VDTAVQSFLASHETRAAYWVTGRIGG
jgi:hypothetical protein